MGSGTDINQKIENISENRISISTMTNIDEKCMTSTEASNIIKDLTIVGGRDVAINQANSAKSMCKLKSVLEQIDTMDFNTTQKSELLDILKQEGGIGVQMTDKDQQIINKVTTEIDIDTTFNIAKKCLMDTIAENRIEGVVLKDVQNINIGQVNSAFSDCIMDDAIAKGVAIESTTKSESGVKSKSEISGFNPIKDVMSGITSLVGGGIMVYVGSIFFSICCCIGCLAIIVLPMILGGSGDQAAERTDEAVDAVTDVAGSVTDVAEQMAEQMGGSISKFFKKNW